MAQVVEWVDSQEDGPVSRALEANDELDAMNAFEAVALWDDRTRGSVYATAQTVLISYSDPGVLTSAISGNRLLSDGGGVNALARFDRDVLAHTNAKYVVVLEGLNDFGLTRPLPAVADLITAHRQLIARTVVSPWAWTALADKPSLRMSASSGGAAGLAALSCGSASGWTRLPRSGRRRYVARSLAWLVMLTCAMPLPICPAPITPILRI